MSAEAPASVPRSRGSLAMEALLIGGLAVAALFWIIPAQTTEGGIGLSPAFLPNLCAAAIGALAAADGLLRMMRGTSIPAYPERWTSLICMGLVAAIGMFALRWGGAVACAVIAPLVGMLVLGERRVLILSVTALICGGTVWLLVR